MTLRIASAPIDAGNNRGSVPAVERDWHFGVADFHHGTGTELPTSVAGYTTASASLPATSIDHNLYLRWESIYGG
jgi:hypothetical protein